MPTVIEYNGRLGDANALIRDGQSGILTIHKVMNIRIESQRPLGHGLSDVSSFPDFAARLPLTNFVGPMDSGLKVINPVGRSPAGYKGITARWFLIE
jgi:hypothetical protein